MYYSNIWDKRRCSLGKYLNRNLSRPGLAVESAFSQIKVVEPESGLVHNRPIDISSLNDTNTVNDHHQCMWQKRYVRNFALFQW